MTHYEKLTVERFEQNLKDGKYDTLTGARRAIGKTASWSDKEKEKAKAIALKHFGGEATPAPKTTKKVGGKAAPKKAAAKPAAAAAPAAKKVVVKAAPKKAAKRVEAAPRAERTPVNAQSASNGPEPRSAREAIQLGTELVGFAGALREGAKLTKTDSPNTNLSPVMEEVNSLLLKAGRLVSRHVEGVQELPPARLAVNSPAQVPVAQAHVIATSALTPPVEAASLTPSEQHMADALKNAQPVSSIGALPRPVAQPTS